MQKRRRALGIVVGILWAVGVYGGAYEAPAADANGEYRDGAVVTARWFAVPPERLAVPGEAAGRWTTVSEAEAFMREMAQTREGLELRWLGESLTGVPIYGILHEGRSENPLRILIQAQVHGNEPGATEGALGIVRALADGALRDYPHSVMVVPVLNPEGARQMERRTAMDIDGNRDYVLQNSAEARLVYRILRDWDPHVVLDMHEHRSWGSPYDLMSIGPNEPNLPEAFNTFVDTAFVEAIGARLAAAELRFGRYRLLRFGEDGAVRLQESAQTFVSAKNALALGGRVSLLTEGRGIGMGTQHYHRRSYAQYLAALAVLETAAARAETVHAWAARLRSEWVAAATGEWIVRTAPVEVEKSIRLLDVRNAEMVDVEGVYIDRSGGVVTQRVPRPAAYIIKAGEQALIDRLRGFGLEVERLTAARSLGVEVMRVVEFKRGSGALYGGQRKRADGSSVWPRVQRNHEITVERTVERRVFAAGSVVVRVAQPMGRYLLSLEPAALSGFAASGWWGDNLEAGFEFPVYRLGVGAVD